VLLTRRRRKKNSKKYTSTIMHGRKRDEYKARLLDPKTAAGLAHKAQQWHALMATLLQQRQTLRERANDNDNDEDAATAVVLDSNHHESHHHHHHHHRKISTNATTMELVEKALLVNPDPSHLWNHRKELVHEKVTLLEAVPLERNQGNDSTPTTTTTAETTTTEMTTTTTTATTTTAWMVYQQELPLTQAAIERNPKAYGAWFHRKWTIHQLLLQYSSSSSSLLCSSSLTTTTTTTNNTTEAQQQKQQKQQQQLNMPVLLQSELDLVTTLLALDERNFHAWNYRRYIVDALATCYYLQYLSTKSSSSFSSLALLLQEVARRMDGSWSLFDTTRSSSTTTTNSSSSKKSGGGGSIMGAQLAVESSFSPRTSGGIPSSLSATSSSSSSCTSPTEFQSLFLLPLIQSEWNFTQLKIEANFSNSSAFFYRGQLLPILHHLEKDERELQQQQHISTTTTTRQEPNQNQSMMDRMEHEFQMMENAMCTEPDDQTAWWYHAFLLDFILVHHDIGSTSSSRDDEEMTNDNNNNNNNNLEVVDYYKNRLQEQLSLLRELRLEEESSSDTTSGEGGGGGGKWILLGLHRVLTVLTDKLCYTSSSSNSNHCILEDDKVKAYRMEQVEVLQRLMQIDPDRKQRYQQLLVEQQQQHQQQQQPPQP
jgi:hypothetical protein